MLTGTGGCTPSWNMTANTNVANGVSNGATSVSDCQTACIHNGSCNGIDWNTGASSGQQCWLGGPWSGAKNVGGATGINHYDLIPCNG
jgi:hypothetical protein